MEHPMVSIVVPVYNAEKYLAECIDSVLAQNYSNWELLLINDGSKDHSGSICDEYAVKDERIKAWHKDNGGVSSTRNLGIQKAIGKYIIFLDSDDYWVGCDFLGDFVHQAEVDCLDILRGEYVRVEDGDRHPSLEREENKSRLGVFDSFTMVNDVMKGEFFSVLFLFKSSLIKGLNFDESLVFGEDINFLIHLFCKDLRCGYQPIKFYAYRQLLCSASNVLNIKNLINSFTFCDRYQQCAVLTNDPRLANLYCYYSVMMYYWTLQTLANNVYHSKYKEVDRLVHLESLRLQVKERIKKVENKSFPVHVYLYPRVAVVLFRIKFQFLEILKHLNLLKLLKKIGVLGKA